MLGEGGPGKANYSGYTIDVLRQVSRVVRFEYTILQLNELEKRYDCESPYDEMVQLLADGVIINRSGLLAFIYYLFAHDGNCTRSMVKLYVAELICQA